MGETITQENTPLKKNQLSNPQSATPSSGNKLALATGSLSALSVLSFSAQAGIIYHDTTPLTVNFFDPLTYTTWDIDGRGGADFGLKGVGSTKTGFARVMLTSGSLNGRGLVQQGTATSQGGYNFSAVPFQNLGNNFVVGPTLAKGYGFGFRLNGLTSRKVAFSGSGGVRQIANSAVGFLTNQKDQKGYGFFGFTFTDGVNLFYGWAELNIDGANLAYTINRWAYNDTPAGSIAVEQTVPEPDTLSLTLLGLGAAGVRAWRRRKQTLAA